MNTYFATMTAAIAEATTMAEQKGFNPSFENIWPEAMYAGQSQKIHVPLFKGSKEQRKMLQIVLYRMDSGTYELTSYIN